MSDLQIVNTFSESRLFRSIDKYQLYSLKDIAEFTYIYILALELFRLSKDHKDFAQKYIQNTIRFNNFKSFKFSANDLYHFLFLLLNKDKQERLKDISHDVNIDFLHLRKFLRDIVNNKIDKPFDRKYLFRLEKELGIKDSNLKAARRMIINWIGQQNNDSMKNSAVTKLLLIIRKRIPKSEIREELEKLARDKLDEDKLDEYKLIKTSKTNVFKNPTRSEFLILVNKHEDLRGLIDDQGNVYVWDAYDIDHWAIMKELNIDIDTACGLYFSILEESVESDLWELELINGIYVGATDYKIANNSKFFNKMLGTDKLDEYKMIKIDTYGRDPTSGSKFINVFKNPTRQEFLALVNKIDLRGLVDVKENLYVWDASKAIHFILGQELAIVIGLDFYDTLMFVKERDYVYSEWEFKEAEGRDGHDVLFASRSQRRKDYGWSNEVKHAVEHSPFVKKVLGFDKPLKEYKIIKTEIGWKHDTEIYKNPSHKELLSLLNTNEELRAVIDKDQNLYVWNSFEAIHYHVQKELNSYGLHTLNSPHLYFYRSPGTNSFPIGPSNIEMYGTENIQKDSMLARALGIKNQIDEYKLIKMDTRETYLSDQTSYLIYKNPTGQQVKQLLDKWKELRGIATINDIYIWKAFDQTHYDAQSDMGRAGIETHFSSDFVFSTANQVDQFDWSNLETIGDYFYGSDRYDKNNRADVKNNKNKFLDRIFKYLRKISG